MCEKLINNQEYDLFTGNLARIRNRLSTHGVRYSLVGGLALKAISDGKVNPRRSNGTIYDFDAVAIGPIGSVIDQAISELERESSHTAIFPSIGIESATFSDVPQKSIIPLAFLSSIRIDSAGRYFLTHGNIEVEVPAETMELRDRKLNGITFQTFPAKTILLRYLTRGGVTKEKDHEKLIHFYNEHILQNWYGEPADDMYIPYLEFADKIRKEYPISVRMFQAYWGFDQVTGNRLSGNSGFLYSLLRPFRK